MIRVRTHIDATPDEVFAVLADGKNYADWVVGAKRVRKVSGGFPRRGARLHHTLGVGPVGVNDHTRVVASEPPHHLELEAHGAGLSALVHFDLIPDSAGTTVLMQEDGNDARSKAVFWITRPLIVARNAETLWRLREQVENDGDVSQPAPAAPETRPAVPRWLADGTARVFGLASALRGKRAFHPRGVALRGRALLVGKGAALAVSPECEVLVRFSRGVGFPSRFPDVNGVAVRLLDARALGRHQDILLASAGSGAFRRVLIPAVAFEQRPFSSILRYRLLGDEVILCAHVDGQGVTLDSLRQPGRSVSVTLFADGQHGREEIAVVTLDAMADEGDLSFKPEANGSDLVPLGLLNALRVPAYAASEAARRG